MKHKTVTILGGGIAGLTTAVSLKKAGIETELFEASAKMKPLGAGLGLGKNAIMAFDALGLKKELIKRGNLLPSFTILDSLGKFIQKPFNNKDENDHQQHNFVIHRAALQDFLLSQLDSSTLHTGKRLVDFTELPNGIKLLFDDNTSHITNYLIVADGIHSPARLKLLPHSLPRYAGYTCWRAVVENPTINITSATETWGKHGRFGIVPLKNNLIYWFACINAKQNDTHFKHFTKDNLLKVFSGYHHPIPELIEQTNDDCLLLNDIIDLKPLKQFAFGRIVLIGDAAHATTPNMGQGACQAIEDAVVLGQCMNQNYDFENAFKLFEKRRLKRTRWIVNTSWKIGQMAQIGNPLLIKLRNKALRILPDSLGHKQLQKLVAVDFIQKL